MSVKPYIPDKEIGIKPYIPDAGAAVKPYVPGEACDCCGGASQCPAGVPEVWGSVSGPALWVANTAYSAGDWAQSSDGDTYVVTTAGTSGIAEPVWDTTVGNTTSDNDVVWTRQNITITWCGETWNLILDSGVEKLFCGFRKFGRQNLYYSTYTGIAPAQALWFFYDYWTITGLELVKRGATSLLTSPTRYRRFGQRYATFSPGLLANYNKLFLQATGNGSITFSGTDRMSGYHTDTFRPIPNTLLLSPRNPGAQQYDLKVLLNSAYSFIETFANYSDYLLTNGFFGNTTLQGITFSWRKGAGW